MGVELGIDPLDTFEVSVAARDRIGRSTIPDVGNGARCEGDEAWVTSLFS